MPKRLRDDVVCFRLQIQLRVKGLTQSGGRTLDTPRTKQVDSGQDLTGVTTNKHTEALHSSTSDDLSPEEQCRKAQHSTGQSPRTIPSFSACIRTLKQRFSRQDTSAASPMFSENVLVPNKLCRCQNLY